MKRGIIVVLLLMLCVGIASADWLTGWDYRKEITINNTGAELTDYQLNFTINRDTGSDSGFVVYVDTKCLDNYNDIRFTTSDGDTLLDYWIESSSSSTAKIWVEVDSIAASGDTTIYFYYGNAGASAVSNGADTFLYFFNKNSTSGWTASYISVTTEGDDLRFYTTDTGHLNIATRFDLTSLPQDFIMETKFYTVSLGANVDSFSILNLDGSFDHRTTQSFAPFPNEETKAKCFVGPSSYYDIYTSLSEGTTYIMRHTVRQSASKVDYDLYSSDRSTLLGSQADKSYAYGSPSAADGIGIGTSATAEEVDARVRFIIFRKYAATEPTITTWGSEEPNIFAEFLGTPTSGSAPITVDFTDETTGTFNIDSWNWSFGDTTYSELQNPTHIYSNIGNYTVSLNVTNTTIGSSLITKTDYISVTEPVVSDFVAIPTCGISPLEVYFIDFSTGYGLYNWSWNFGDGNTSYLRNPKHFYNTSEQCYNVTLNVTGIDGSNERTKIDYICTTNCYNVTPTPTPTPTPDPYASFGANITTGCAPLSVLFTSTSTGTPTLNYDWYMNGDWYDTPTVVYSFGVGTYTISLNVSNGLGYDWENKTDYIVVTNCTPTPTPTTTATTSTGGSGSGQQFTSANSMSISSLTSVVLALGAMAFAGIIGLIILMGRRQ